MNLDALLLDMEAICLHLESLEQWACLTKATNVRDGLKELCQALEPKLPN